jgi:signal transduction histidine kinase
MNNSKIFGRICWFTAGLMILVIFWDHFTLKVDTTTLDYILVKGIIISSYILMGFLSHYYQKATWQQAAYGVLFYIYSFYGMAYLDMTYSFSFIEAFLVMAIGIKTTSRNFIFVSIFGLIGLIAGHYYALEPSFVAVGQSYRPHSFTVSFILWLLAFVIHFLITRQQATINELNEKFALIGKQSSFLMHEIKNPLGRVVANAEAGLTEDIIQDIRRDSQKISAIVNSVEILINDPKSLSKTFTNFDWSEVSENLSLDFNSYLNSMNIKYDFSGLKGRFYGNKSLLYQLLKNHVVNAIEAIGFRKEETSEIRVNLEYVGQNLHLIITNTNSFIHPKDMDRIFEPHFTTKKSGVNKGLGLALSKSIVEAHDGKIKASSIENKTSFLITFRCKAT